MDEEAGLALSPKRRSEDDVVADLDAALNPAKNYPRKRVAVACEVCRLRKTKCDARRPCSFCSESGIECVYRQPGIGEKGTSATDVLYRIEERLARVEEILNNGSATSPNAFGDINNGSTAGQTPGSLADRRTSGSTVLGEVSRRNIMSDDMKSYFQHVIAASHNDFSFRQTAGEAVTARPSLISFSTTWYIRFETWDDTKEFYDDELAAEEYLFQLMDSGIGQGLDMTPRTLWQLQQQFVRGYLQWLPVIGVGEFTDHIAIACNGHFSRQSPSDCLVMFALAIGSLEQARSSTGSRTLEKPHPGLEYLAAGREILTVLSKRSRRRDVTILQCRVMEVSYWNMVLRPLLAWDGIMEIARDCMHLLSSGAIDRMDHKDKLNFHRIFWVTSVLVHELEAILKMHPFGFRQFHETVPLPLSNANDEGYLYFFAQVSLRKLLMEVLTIVGYRVGQVIYAPVVAAELCKQVEEWYDHLPAGVCFPKTTTPLYDIRRAFLRLQYLTLHTVIFWPSVLQLMEHSAIPTDGSTKLQERIPSLKKDAKLFVDYAIMICEVSEELLMEGHVGLQFCFWVAYANAIMLLICYRQPNLSFIPETTDDQPFRKVFRLMKPWKAIKVIWRALERVTPILNRLGIRVEDEISSHCATLSTGSESQTRIHDR